jgi:6-phosphogluconolactonase
MHDWSVYQQLEAASRAAADFLAEQILASIEARGVCHVIVPGGSTPARCFDYLVQKSLPWQKVHWYPGDERCYPPGHPERNDVMLREHLITRVPASHFHAMLAELGPEQAATAYRKTINDIEVFDIAFLGMGEDGHTASLFPGDAALQDTNTVVAVYGSPKPPAERVSMGLNTLRQARVRMVLAAGASKAAVIQRIRAGEPVPVNCIGDIHWFVDEACLLKTTREGND